MLKKLFPVLLCVILFFGAASKTILAQTPAPTQVSTPNDKGITISPVKFEYDAGPGETVKGTLKLLNATSGDKTVYLYLRNFVSDGASGTPLFITEEKPYTASLKDWIALQTDNILVKNVAADNPNEVKVNFEIKIPANAEPGGHYAGIIATLSKPGSNPIPEKGNLAFKDDRAAIILLNVKGDVLRSLSVDKFYATDAFTKDKPAISIFEWMPVGFLTELRNFGNSHTVPLGDILIYNGDSKIDQIQFNPENGNILRESSRDFINKWTGALVELVPVLDENGNQVVDGNGNVQARFSFNLQNARVPLGKYTAKLAVGYDDDGSKKSLIATYDFWVFPWKLVLAILLVVAGYIYYKYRKSKTHRKH